ncbi:hypothetical protein [Mesorhizobium sp.]|uniref:hypothetical protein n=1 Tax=Mesorhizobium sp. TaxID=1871066 RepID=UPI0025C1A5B8|nr:hypothetical protein [Mesorhizobium sp.]
MKMNRRNALALGATSLAAPLLVTKPTPTAAKAYGPTDGKEIFPGVRLVELGTRDSHIKGYKKIVMEDVVYQPKATSPLGDVMTDDMVCTVTEGELEVTAGDMKFAAKEGDGMELWQRQHQGGCHQQWNGGRSNAGDQPAGRIAKVAASALWLAAGASRWGELPELAPARRPEGRRICKSANLPRKAMA